MASQMNIQDSTALGARKAFWQRPFKHFGWGIAVFIPVCFVLMIYLNPFVAAGLALIPAIFIYFYLESRLIVIECPSCQKDINTDTPWLCGFKGCRNENVAQFPFIYECEHCHYPPKAYVCHHCGRLVFLTSDRQAAHAAKRLDPGPPPVKTVVVVKDVVGDKVATQKEEIRDLEHKLKKTTIEKEIEIVKNKPSVPSPIRPEVQIIVERVRRGVENGKTLIDLERQLNEEARAAYPNDPDAQAEMEKNITEAIFREKERTSGSF